LLNIEHLLKDPRFATNADRIANREQLSELIEAVLRNMDRDYLVEQLRDAGMPCAPVLDVGQALADSHVRARGILHEWEHPEYGSVTQIKTPISEDGVMPAIRSPSPFLGQHTREVLGELGYTAAEIDKLVEKGAAITAKSTK
jgi:crotonobetainyl-CoA:carnitine CoA-transferase CaiB-like acyl-CoA transferase